MRHSLTSYTVLPFLGLLVLGCGQSVRRTGDREVSEPAEVVQRPIEAAVDADSADRPEHVGTHVPGFAVVELFTSEGCSSCPAADRNLMRIAQEAMTRNVDVYPLSFHVDYWNHLGWDDPFSSEIASRRQRQYARSFSSKRVYTPQMVVNGTVEFVGSGRSRSDRVINNAIQNAPEAALLTSSRSNQDGLIVDWMAEGLRPGDVINVALVQNKAQRVVSAGENTGRTLEHVNVVREFTTIDDAPTEGTTVLTRRENISPDEFHIVAYIQSGRSGPIRAAARTVWPASEPDG